MLYVEKAAIIPKITGVELSERMSGEPAVQFVSAIARHAAHNWCCVEGEAAWVCPNKYGCVPADSWQNRTFFVGRRMMNIDGIEENRRRLCMPAALGRHPPTSTTLA